jgi:thymidylate synthase
MSMDNSSEYQYLELLNDVLENGDKIESRSGHVLSTFTRNLVYNIEQTDKPNIYTFPMITTKRIYLRRVFEELMWMLRGQTDATILAKQGNHIWDGNTSRKALDNIGLTNYKEGELGPGYGAQLIHWGGNQNFINGSLIMTGGINQIKYIIDELKNNPFSRRAMINLWNPTDLNKMALPPCHTSYYFSSSDKKILNCNVVLRSNDLFLGNPFNQIFTQLLTIFIAHSVNMIPGKVGMTMMIPHIYYNHIQQVKEQLKRKPLKYPTLQIKKHINSYDDIINLKYDDIELYDYYYHPKLTAPMTV